MLLFGNRFVALAIFTFVAVVLLVEGLYLLWNERRGPTARKLRSRLEELAVENDSAKARILKEQALSSNAFERIAQMLPGSATIRNWLAQSGLGWSAGTLLVWSLGAGAAGALAGVLLRLPPLLALAVAAVAALVPGARVHRAAAKRLARLEEQFPDALDLIGRGLRAGHAFTAALKMAGDDLPAPVGSEFRAVHEEVNYGVSMQQALENLAERVPSTDVRYFVVAVLIQRESGGNLTEILDGLSRLVRERLKLRGRIRVLAAEGRLSAWILGALPFALGGLFTLLNPEFMRPLWTDPVGTTLLQVMGVLMFFGALMLRAIARIRV